MKGSRRGNYNSTGKNGQAGVVHVSARLAKKQVREEARPHLPTLTTTVYKLMMIRILLTSIIKSYTVKIIIKIRAKD